MKRIALVLTLLLIISGGLSLAWGYNAMRQPVNHTSADEYIEIPRGSSPDKIVDTLAEKGIVKQPSLLKYYLKLRGLGPKLKAGEYRFSSPISPLGVIAKLQVGEQRLSRFTVIEGWTRWDIADAMLKIPELKLESADAALKLMDNTELIADIDSQAENLEGYLYPDTYSFPPDTSAARVIAEMVKRFRREWTNERAAKAKELGLTARQIVTIASLIETEAKVTDERPVVASVIYNRLKINMPLGIDSSVIYASKLAGKWRNDGKVYQSDLDRESPYNTRKVTGLPPAPIASVSRTAIDAALNPATTNYLYYVRDPARNDGAHDFYSNETEFYRGVQALRQWERERNLKN